MTESTTLAPGVPCYLTNLTRGFEHLTGRIVVIERLHAPGEYFVTGEWVLDQFPAGMIAPRSRLLPITPPGIAPPEANEHAPETVSR